MPNNKNRHKNKHGNKKRNNELDDKIVDIVVDGNATNSEINHNKAYDVKNSDIFGRYLVASRDLSPCEIIIQQSPLVIGPIANCNYVPVCVNCYNPLGSMSGCYRCSNCQFPLCGKHCNDRDHTKDECSFFKDNNLAKYLHKDDNTIELQHDYEAIIILRCLMLKTLSEQLWQKLNEMESHCEIRKSIPALWNRNQKTIVNRIRDQWNLLQFSEDEIHRICGILEVNCFEVGGGQTNSTARALFPEAYLMCHDCVPNTNHTDNPKTHELIVRTTKAMKKGDVISLSYAYTLQGTLKRRSHLHEAKFFWCTCERCKSNDELQTHASTLLCPKCTNGFVLSTDPLNENAEWRCQKCNFSLTAIFVMNLVTRLYDELDALGGNDINQIEMFIKKYSKTLHKNHYIFLSAKHSLCQLYGKIDGFLINELSVDQLKHKETYCRDLLEVIDILEPGSSRLRGVILYELHAPIMLQITRELQMGLIKPADFKKRLREVIQILQKSYDILKHEPSGSQEFEMAVAAKSALNSMKL
ncbi:SET domain-containing protein SmydA-8-like [Chironomus tepperi]|uniref:SET domain-containing protein SmydA-8-like n=1 Tax=Chironomus tepperi TaxID=113505 RepID=UPI00391EF079